MRILVVDDNQVFSDGVRALLERGPMAACGKADSALQAWAHLRREGAELVVMDVALPDLNGIEATRSVLATASDVKIIGVSESNDNRLVREMLAAGASGYVLKPESAQELVLAAREVLAGRIYVSPAVEQSPGGWRRNPVTISLTEREKEVLQMLAEGKTTKEVAAKLGLAVSTVETHRRHLADKLGIRTIAELTKYAIRAGLTSLE